MEDSDRDTSSESEDSDISQNPTSPGNSPRLVSPRLSAARDDVDFTEDQLELFRYIKQFQPKHIELETVLKPLIPDYIPSIGTVDAFIKPRRPDLAPLDESKLGDDPDASSGDAAAPRDECGLAFVDEPAAKQSNASILQMHLKALSKRHNTSRIRVETIQRADRHPKKIDSWIESIEQLHRTKPPPEVTYTRPMPSIDRLMQVWPPELERLLRTVEFPSADVDMSLEEYSRLICSFMDIPVHKGNGGVAQSLHVLFTLWVAFRNNQHFKHMISVNHFPEDDFRPSTPDAIAAVQRAMGERPSTAGVLQTLEARPDTASAIAAIARLEGSRPDTASAIRAVQAMEEAEAAAQREREAMGAGDTNLYRPDTAAALKAVADFEAKEAERQSETPSYK